MTTQRTKSIIERLREAGEDYANPEQRLIREAADEIERLRIQLEAELKWRRDNDGD